MAYRRNRNITRREWAIPSPLTVAIVALALILWFANFVPTTLYSGCDYAAYWVGGWFSFSSLFQWVAVAIAASIVLWLVSLLDRDRRKALGETLAQGALLFALAFWLLAVKSYLFPHAAPTHTRMIAIVGALFPMEAVLVREDHPLVGAGDPGRPRVEFEDHPFDNPAINKKMEDIFTSRYSPTAADMKRLEACLAEQRRALAQWKLDRETLRAWYDDEFYREKPKRPRDWKEERMEEIEREGE